MNKSKSPIIPPLLVNKTFIFDCAEKAKHFIDFFSRQCRLIANDSILPLFNYRTNARTDNFLISDEDIISLVRQINPNKAMGSDGISGQMLILCDATVTLPLKILFQNILDTSVFPDSWKLANVTPFSKRVTKES